MQRIDLRGTEDTPAIVLDKEAGIFQMGGRSLPEDVNKFYAPIMSWIDAYGKDPNPETNLEVNFEYFNTASAKLLLDLFTKFDGIQGTKASITWSYDKNDDDMKEAGEEFADFLSIPFNIVERA